MKEKRKFLIFSFYTIFIFFFKIKFSNSLFANFNKKNQTVVLTHKIVLKHLISKNHPEKSERILELIKLLKKKKLGILIREINLKTKENNWINTIHSNFHINSLKNKKVKVSGPFSADTIFLEKNRKKFDVIVGMYHDQVLTPMKTIFGFNAINITIGLPFIRITPDHGPNYEMFGLNKSDPQSLIQAFNFLNKYVD